MSDEAVQCARAMIHHQRQAAANGIAHCVPAEAFDQQFDGTVQRACLECCGCTHKVGLTSFAQAVFQICSTAASRQRGESTCQRGLKAWGPTNKMPPERPPARHSSARNFPEHLQGRNAERTFARDQNLQSISCVPCWKLGACTFSNWFNKSSGDPWWAWIHAAQRDAPGSPKHCKPCQGGAHCGTSGNARACPRTDPFQASCAVLPHTMSWPS